MTTRAASANGRDTELSNRVIVVTGASDGIGKAAVSALVQRGATVVMVGRNEAKTAAAARAIMSAVPGASARDAVTWEVADLARQDAVHELATRLRDRLPRIDALINNAGALFMTREVTAEGLERTFALNHLAYFTLTLRLLDRLAASADATGTPARVVCVSSRAHEEARFDHANLQFANAYAAWRAYGNSKLANILFTKALARRTEPTRLVVHALHPGVVATRFAVNDNGRRGRLARRIMDFVSISPERGADTMVWLATTPEALDTTGRYWVKRREAEPSRVARDEGEAEFLWQESMCLTGLDADAMIRNAKLGRVV